MAQIAQDVRFEAGERLRTFLPSVEDRKGLLLSHFIGFCIFAEFALNVLQIQIPFTPSNSLPIRLVMVWLLVDRSWRIGRLRFGFWDYLMLGFIMMVGVGMIYTATTAPQIPLSFDDFRRFVGQTINGYIYYLVVKEAINRRGFRPDITIKWLIAGLAWSAMVGLMQALNLAGARSWSLIYARSNLEYLRVQDDISLASGTAPWWNSMALEMLAAFGIVFSPTFLRRPRWYEWMLGILYVSAFIATQSRGGLVAFAACTVGTFVYFLIHKKYLTASIIATVATAGVIVWVFAVFALKIDRFTRTLEGEKVRGSVYAASIDTRIQKQTAAVAVGTKQPLFGTGPSYLLFPGPLAKFTMTSPYAVMGDIDGQYALLFAQFGLVGIIFVFLLQGYMIAFIRKETAFRPYAFAAFFIGVAFTVHGIVEFLLYSRIFIILNVMAALAGSSFLVTEKGRGLYRRIVKTQHAPALGRGVDPPGLP